MTFRMQCSFYVEIIVMYYGFESAAPLVALGGGAVACRAAEAYTSAVGGDYAHYIVLLEGSLNGDNPYGKYADALVAGYGLGSALVYDDGTLGEALAAGCGLRPRQRPRL